MNDSPRLLAPWPIVWILILLSLSGAAWVTAGSPSALREVLGPDRAAVNLGEALLLAFALVVPLRSRSLGRFGEETAWVLLSAAPFVVAAWRWSTPAVGPFDLVLGSQILLAGAAVTAGVGRGGRAARLYGGCVIALFVIPPFLSYFVGEMIGPGTLEIADLSPFWTTRSRLLGRAAVDTRLAIGANAVLAVGFVVAAAGRRRRVAL